MKKDSDKTENSNFDFIKFFNVCLKSWKIYVFFIVGFISLIGLYLIIRTPKFEVDAQLKLPNETSTGVFGDLSSSFLVGDMFGSSSVDNEIGVITSHNVFFNTAKDLKLNVNYAEKKWFFKWKAVFTKSPLVMTTLPSIPDTLRTSIVFVLNRLEGDNVDIEVKVQKKTIMELENQTLPTIVDTPYGPFSIAKTEYYDNSEAYGYKISYSSYNAAAEYYQNLVDVFAPNKKADFISLAFKTPDPTFGMELLNTIIANYNQVGIRIKDLKNYETLDFVNKRLETLQQEIAHTEQTKEQFKRNNNLTMVETDASFELEKLSRYETAVIQTETEVKILKETFDFVSNPVNKYSVIPDLPSASVSAGDLTTDPSFSVISSATKELNAYNQLVLERMRLVGTSAKNSNASVRQIDEQIDALHQSIITSISRAYDNAIVRYKEANRQYNIAQSRLGTLPTLEKEYLGIERDLLVQEQLYLYLLKQREEASMNIAKSSHSIDVIDVPHTLTEPLGLSNKISIAIAIFLGLVAGTLWVFVFQYNNAPTSSLAESKRLIKAPIANPTICHNDAYSESVMDTPDSATAEAFRKLRSDLQFILSDFDGKVIAIESIGNDAGKTFVASNIALAFAKSGKPTLLVDASMHNPGIAQFLGVADNEGLAESLRNDKQPTIIQCQDLSVITAGKDKTVHPSELISSGRFNNLIDELKAKYQYIIIDTPSIAKHSDALAISNVPDLTVIIVRQNLTTPAEIEKINELYSDARLKRMIVVANDVPQKEA